MINSLPTINLLERLKTKAAKICIAGLGYTGLPFAISLAESGFQVLGIDTDQKLLDALSNGLTKIKDDALHDRLLECLQSRKLRVDSRVQSEDAFDCAVVCVPTPVGQNGQPDMHHIRDAVRSLLPSLRRPGLVIIESSVYPGATRNEISTWVNDCGRLVGKDIFLSYCPERIDPGNTIYHLENTPRIISGIDEQSAKLAHALYSSIVKAKLVLVSDTTTAEVVKSFENASRLVNISLVNELARLCEALGVDVHEVVTAASSKPFGFQPYFPSAGAGGHCLPKDSVYLLSAARVYGSPMSTLAAAVDVNDRQPLRIANIIMEHISSSQANVLIVGLGYKENIGDLRDSPGVKICYKLKSLGHRVTAFEPNVSKEELQRLEVDTIVDSEDAVIGYFDCVCVVQHHQGTQQLIDKLVRLGSCKTIVDCKGKLRISSDSNVRMVRIGDGRGSTVTRQASVEKILEQQ